MTNTLKNNQMTITNYKETIKQNWNQIEYSFKTGGVSVPKRFTSVSASEIFFDLFGKMPSEIEKTNFVKQLNKYRKQTTS